MRDREFLKAFENQSLDKADWTHRAHIRVAYLLLLRWGMCAAISRMRRGILLLNRAHGVENGPESGFHETITIAWMAMVRHAISDSGLLGSFDEFIERHPHFLSADALAAHYSRERLFSPEARAGFVSPDRKALPVDVLRVLELLRLIEQKQSVSLGTVYPSSVQPV